MPDHRQVYQLGAAQYQRLIDREDYQGNLLPALQRISPLEGLDLVDLGAGTGRLACLLGPAAASLFAFDASPHMLETAAARLSSLPIDRWLAAAADHRRIPLAASSADLVVSGWSICYLVVWEESRWQSSLRDGLREISRLLRRGGTAVIVETLGTGVDTPQAPETLQAYFDFLAGSGFSQTWIRTDYRFQSQQEAQELVGYFFGPEMLERIGPEPEPILPECTGLWWKTVT